MTTGAIPIPACPWPTADEMMKGLEQERLHLELIESLRLSPLPGLPPLPVVDMTEHVLRDMDRVDCVTINGRLLIDDEGEPSGNAVVQGRPGQPWRVSVQFDVAAHANEFYGGDRPHERPRDLDGDGWQAAAQEHGLANQLRAYIGVVEGKRRADHAKRAAMADLCRPLVKRKEQSR
ncbi:MAG: hypothetical protein HOW73_47675 [Polyangiaceae bacterium]|nr:hypothetical protein [Polyangiaceae bacterium]